MLCFDTIHRRGDRSAFFKIAFLTQFVPYFKYDRAPNVTTVVLRFVFNIEISISSSGPTLFLALALVFAILANAAYVFYQFSQNSFKQLWTIRLLRTSSSLVMGPLFIPLVTVFIQQTPCLAPVSTCYSSTQTILASVSILGCFFYVVLCLILTATFYARDPQSDNPVARPSSRSSLFHLLVELALTISFLAFETMPKAKWFLILLFTFGVGSVAWINTWVCLAVIFLSLARLVELTLLFEFVHVLIFYTISTCRTIGSFTTWFVAPCIGFCRGSASR